MTGMQSDIKTAPSSATLSSSNAPAAAPLAVPASALPNPQALNAVERFDGLGDAHAWVNAFLQLASLYQWVDEVCLKVALIRLKGNAQRWAQNKQFASWQDFQNQFLSRFGETTETAISRLSR